jgi:hypothetical protein
METDNKINDYFIERLSEHNLHDVEKLHTAVYGKVPPAGFFFKKYNTSFTQVKYIGFIAYNTNRVAIAYYGVIPCFIKVNDTIVLAAQSADTMTHPQFRFKGLFVELSNITFQLCLDNDINLLFGFPNQNSLPGAINKLGWQMTGQMDCFIIASGGLVWDKVFSKLPVLRGIFSAYQKSCLKKYLLPKQGMANSVLEDGFSGVYRDRHYLNYKSYTDNHIIKIGNSLLWIKIGRELLIGDILVKQADFDSVIYQLKLLCRRLGVAGIQFHTSTGTSLHNLFSARFEALPSFAVLFQNLKGDVPIDKIKFTSADIDTF